MGADNVPRRPGRPACDITLKAVSDLGRYYEILGIVRGASPQEIKQAWRDLAQVWHPDRFPGNPRLRKKAQETLKQVNEAYDVLRGARGAPPRTAERPAGGRSAQWESAGQQGEWGAEAERDPLALLCQGVHAWNLWRKKYSDLSPKLVGANLRKADLAGYDLRDLDLSQAKMQEADLYKADLSGAVLAKARLNRADLSRATLVETKLTSADLTEADLSSADLTGSRFDGAVLAGANLVGAILYRADMTRAAGLTAGQVEVTLTDARTKLPSSL